MEGAIAARRRLVAMARLRWAGDDLAAQAQAMPGTVGLFTL
jgi:hypothetical protein